MVIIVVWYPPHSLGPQKARPSELCHLRLCIRVLLCSSHLYTCQSHKQDLSPICFLICDGRDHCFHPSMMKKWRWGLQGGWEVKLGEFKKCPELLFLRLKPSRECCYIAKPFRGDENRIYRLPGPCGFSRSSSDYGHSFFWIALPHSASTT